MYIKWQNKGVKSWVLHPSPLKKNFVLEIPVSMVKPPTHVHTHGTLCITKDNNKCMLGCEDASQRTYPSKLRPHLSITNTHADVHV